ncbi:NADH-quinone oxidoreductase subunit M [Candidatus Blochmannia ocreatus (nom. nud.)]|uniref:NADH-quinone oxidoreductase subunit M n=1 Tax=Candidatus Blochmannia ocreatus (nom. nud.) TaxID=251538 RepID=A0ABY4SSM0_9ENTR|nr:NADH-quinone oxidoreductase subunit M [Candidatus Blochmannia ocreatus]URJ24974.1 NADH-quinone oxidoreductase subunit M [Candidatus Blochmannia ocreatus]
MFLIILILIPFICSVLCWRTERVACWLPRWIALFSSGIILLFIIFLWRLHWDDASSVTNIYTNFPKWKLEYSYPWIPRFGISLHIALDGLSALMIMLSGFIGCMAVLCSWNEIKHDQGLFYCNLLWIIGGVIGVFLSVDMFLFFFFWEMIIIPMYFLVSLWGHNDIDSNVRINTAVKFFIYAQCSGLLMLISIITLASINYRMNGIWSFNYQDLLHIVLPRNVEYLLMLGFFLAFAVKMPIVPFHGWLPDMHCYAPTAGSVDLVGMLLKISAYGLFRFVLPLFPYASQSFTPIAMFLGVLNIFYGAYMACAQTDIKRLIAYSSISHMGFLLIAIYSGLEMSYQGSVILMVSYSLSASGMFILCGQLYERLHTRDMRFMGGLWNKMSCFPAFFLCFILATLGLPGTGNFVGEVTVLCSNFRVSPIITIIVCFGIVFSSIYSLLLMQRIFYGIFYISNPRDVSFIGLKHMEFREKLIAIFLLISIFFIGFFPKYILDISHESMKYLNIWLKK